MTVNGLRVPQGEAREDKARASALTHHVSRITHPNSPAAFTLIELLIVISIIALLAALLLPTLTRSQGLARRVRCSGNLHQLGLAVHMYWDDNGGRCFRYGPVVTNGGQLYWFGWLGTGAEGQRPFDAAQGTLYPYLQGRGVELCPAFNYSLPALKLKAAGASYGYGYNLALSLEPPLKTSGIREPTQAALLADAAQVNTWQAPASAGHPMLEEWYYIDGGTNQPNGHFRHLQKANALFCDGHVAPERFVSGSIDPRMPGQLVGRFRQEILNLR
jgi:prepilin-type N-terminal cleavage/methylation domain-containing protein/prepilin-type processing-associated H-X9-DG protein